MVGNVDVAPAAADQPPSISEGIEGGGGESTGQMRGAFGPVQAVTRHGSPSGQLADAYAEIEQAGGAELGGPRTPVRDPRSGYPLRPTVVRWPGGGGRAAPHAR